MPYLYDIDNGNTMLDSEIWPENKRIKGTFKCTRCNHVNLGIVGTAEKDEVVFKLMQKIDELTEQNIHFEQQIKNFVKTVGGGDVLIRPIKYIKGSAKC